jgi:oligopeptide transport system substrate-binding protein
MANPLKFLIIFFCLTTPLLAAEPKIASDRELRFRLTTGPVTLDWNQAHTSQETYILMNIMEGLLEEGPDLKPRPALAESWEVTPDGKTYTFTLRPGVKWSDGQILRAEDFEESWFRLIDPKLKCTYANILFDIVNAENYFTGKLKDRSQVGIKAISARKLQIQLRYPVSHFPHLMAIWTTFPIRADLIRKHGANWSKPGKLAILGPYQLQEWKKGKGLRLRKNPLYHDAAAIKEAPENVQVTIERDDQRVRQEFDRGKLDFLQDISTQDLLNYRKESGSRDVRIVQFPYLATYYLAFNTRLGPLANPLVRKAIAIALDKPSIPTVLQGGEQVATSWLPPGISGSGQNSGLTGSLYDAKAGLAKAGFPEGRGFPRLQFWIEKFDGADRLAQHIAKTLNDRLGIMIDIHLGNSDDYRGSSDGAFFLTRWVADYPDAYSFLLFFSKNLNNYANWSNPTYDGLLQRAIQSPNEVDRIAAYVAAEKILIEEDTAIYPLFYRKRSAALNPRIEKLEISPVDYFFIKAVKLRPDPK